MTAFTCGGGLDAYGMVLPEAEASTAAGQPAFVGDQGIPGACAEQLALLVAERLLEFLAAR